ncbi:MAG: arylsulfatase [Bacteroidales bacterium]|nr:arylsulfatase [Bacteroidales bacterium]MCF8391814.1 arylsulfatase [Bacteroidales bacterium]
MEANFFLKEIIAHPLFFNTIIKMNIKTIPVFLAIPLLNWLHCAAQDSNKNDVPNIVFIMADDLGYGDLACYGQEKMETPNIDKLAEEGMRFTQAYAGGPVCTPSRSSLMTGLHNGHGVARDNIPHFSTYLQDEDITIAEVLKNAGYLTGGVGKWSLGDAGTVGRATNQGFDFWLGYLNQDHAHYYYPEYLDYNEKRLELKGNTVLRNSYSHNVLTNGAMNFIRSSAEKPFFLYVAYTIPHYSAAEEDEHGLTVPSTKPYSEKKWPESAKKYAAMLYMLDKDVGRIVKLIDELGLKENTLIIFTSDNGGHSSIWEEFHTGGPLRGFKRDLTEGGIRVPFIASWPGKIEEGSVSDEIIAFQDMMPSFAELAGKNPPKKIDGISILPTLLGDEQKNKHSFLYWDYGHCRDRYDQAVRMGEWKAIRQGIDGQIQLYNLNEDISEEHNVANFHPDIVKKMAKIMEAEYLPSDLYPIGELYQGGPIWKKEDY